MQYQYIFMKFFIYIIFIFICFNTTVQAQLSNKKILFTNADTLRGSNGTYRQGWDVLRYSITVQPNLTTKTLAGKCEMMFYDQGATLMQIDLQQPMILDSAKEGTTKYTFKREGNVYWLMYRDTSSQLAYKIKPSIRTLTFYFKGTPKEAARAPWDGGWVWKKDKLNNPWATVACQGLGASVWYPCKDIQSDKPDSGAVLHIIVPDSLVGIGNGKLVNKIALPSNLMQYTWVVKNPINNYCIVPYIGKYVNFSENYEGLNGNLNMSYWVLPYNQQKAKIQFADAPKMMKAFEHWFGPYPFYEDDYKLVDAPYLGMEHQSAIAYGNQYKMGYNGTDLSGTGEGLKWDFIIVHESGHEWFANSICTKDIADMWVHEGFTNYSETLFTEYYWGKPAGDIYVQGLRKNIQNDIPIIGPYGVNKEGSGDMYPKAANMLHTIRSMVNDDAKFRQLLLDYTKNFRYKTVTTQEVEAYISKYLGINCSSIFNQYLRTTTVPLLTYQVNGNTIKYKWQSVVSNFNMPIKINTNTKSFFISPTEKWKSIKLANNAQAQSFSVDNNFYITQLKVLR